MLLALCRRRCCFAGGVWLIVVGGVAGARPSLAGGAGPTAHAGLSRRSIIPTTASDRAIVVASLGRWLLRRVRASVLADEQTACRPGARRPPARGVRRRLRVLRDRRRCSLGPVVWAGAAIAGTPLPVAGADLVADAASAPSSVVPARVRAARRGGDGPHDFRHALGAYLDVLVLLLPPGEGPEWAMEIAARAGNGTGVHRAAPRHRRRPACPASRCGTPSTTSAVGLGIAELREIAAAGDLAGEPGAAVRRSLIAKARSLRSTSLAAAETQPRRRKSQAMFAPLVLMGVGFVLFLIYPLVTNLSIGGPDDVVPPHPAPPRPTGRPLMTQYQLARIYLEVLLGRFARTVGHDERGEVDEKIVVVGAAVVGAAVVGGDHLGQAAPTERTTSRRPRHDGAVARPRGVAATIVLFPIFVAVTFMFVQGVYWQLDRQVAVAAADRASEAVAMYGSSAGRPRPSPSSRWNRPASSDVSVSVSRGSDMTTVTVSGTSPGIIAGTSVHVSARSVTPSEGCAARDERPSSPVVTSAATATSRRSSSSFRWPWRSCCCSCCSAGKAPAPRG